MKKIFLVVLFVLMASCFVGCGKEAESLVQEKTIQAVSQETNENIQTESSSQETIEESITDETVNEEPVVNTEDKVSSVVTTHGALRVEGTQLVDSNGNAVQLRGVSTHGIAWFPQYVNRDFFTELHDEWNANVVRLAMYTAEYGGYCSDGNQEELKQLIKDGVKYAAEAEMYVIVDWHVLQEANPNTNKEEAKKFFEEMSKEFREADNVLYEICNEPNGATTWSEIKSYAEEVIPVIRANDEDAIIIVGTPTWSQEVDKAAVDPIEGYDNIMYTLHFYAASHTDWLRDRMVKAIDAGLPVFVTEFGTCDASGNGRMDVEQSNKWIQAMDEYGVSYVAWNLSNKAESSAIFQQGCAKTSGFIAEDLTENGKWIYEMLTGEHAEHLESDLVESNESVQDTSRSLTYTAAISNSWESDGRTFYQYTLNIENASGQDMDEWSVMLTFDETFTFSEGWNANFTVENNMLVLRPVEYNSRLAAGGSISDIGFIISSP